MNKKIFSLVLFFVAICVSISIGTSVSFAYAAEQQVTAEVAIERAYFDNVNKSIGLYEEVLKPYTSKKSTRSSNKNFAYRNDFGGVYIDESGLLNIGVVGLQNERREFDGQVIYKQHRFSYQYLFDMQENLSLIMGELGIYALSMDVQENRIDIFTNKGVSDISSFLQEKTIYDKESYRIVFNPNGGDIENANTYGGDRLNTNGFLGIKNYAGTMAVNAICNDTGRYGILTNEHVAVLGTMHTDGKYDIAAFYNYSYFTSILYWEGYPSPSSTLIFTYQGKRWN